MHWKVLARFFHYFCINRSIKPEYSDPKCPSQELLFAHELPQPFDEVQVGRTGRQVYQRDRNVFLEPGLHICIPVVGRVIAEKVDCPFSRAFEQYFFA